MTVYIVEDDPGVADSLRLVVEMLGHAAQAFASAESFFEQAAPQCRDTVLVDLGLPGISGTQVIRTLKQMQDPPRIVAITGQPQLAIERELSGVAQVELLRKPLSEQAINELL